MKRFALALLLIFWTISCGKGPEVFKELPKGLIKHQLIVLAKVNGGVRARGLKGAVPKATTVYCQVGNVHQQTTSDEDGRFNLLLKNVDEKIADGEFTFTVDQKIFRQSYKIKDLVKSLNQVAHPAFKGPPEIHSIAYGNDDVAILSSTAALVKTFSLTKHWSLGEQKGSAILFNREADTSVGATTVERLDNHLLVPLFSTHEIALLDPNKASVEDKRGATSTIEVKNPYAVAAISDNLFVASFTNFHKIYDDEGPAVLGPGVVALMAVESGKIVTKSTLELRCKNPTKFMVVDQKTVWVSCSGAWESIGKKVEASQAGMARLQIEKESDGSLKLVLAHSITLGRFSPSKAALVNSKLIIPHAYSNQVAVIDQNKDKIEEVDIKKLERNGETFQFTFAKHWHDDIVFLGDSMGKLIAFSLSEGFFPFPFINPIRVTPESDENISVGPEIYFRHQAQKTDLSKTYPVGFNAWVISSTQSKIWPLDFLQVFGP